LLKIQKNDLLKQFARFRLSSHHLEIKVGRFVGIDRDQRLCRFCNMNVVESEYHFLLCCDNYRHLRLKFIGHISWPTLNLFQTTMTSKKINKILGICKYLKEAMLYINVSLHKYILYMHVYYAWIFICVLCGVWWYYLTVLFVFAIIML
jgi:hypothetical protein